MTRTTYPSFSLLLGLAFAAGPAGAMTLDPALPSSGSLTRAQGRVLALRPDAAARQTEVVLGDLAGREVARFSVLGDDHGASPPVSIKDIGEVAENLIKAANK